MRPRLSTLAAAAALAACGGGPPKPAGLAYSLPDPSSVTYTTGDTIKIDVDAGGQIIPVDLGVSYALSAAFSRAPDGVRISAEVQDFHAMQSNPMGAPITADGSGISGPVVFSLDRRGTPTLESQPEVTGSSASFFQPLEVAHMFFPRLSGRAAHPGDTWTDTIHFESSRQEGDLAYTTVLKYAVAGDTVVAGRSLLKIAVEGTAESTTSGSVGGMDFSQKVSGDVTGWVLWDVERALMTEMFGSTDANGTMDVSVAPYPMSIHYMKQSRTRLADER